jgi:hypothetical protein
MGAHNRKLKELVLDIGGTEFQIQCRKAEVQNNTDDGETFFTYGGDDGTFVEPADDSYALDLEFYADYRSNGISDYLWLQDGNTVTFQVTHNPDVPAETVSWSGSLLIKAPNALGDVRTTEITATTLQIVGKPDYTRP